MERLFGEFHHFVAIGPGVDAGIDQESRHGVEHESRSREIVVERGIAEQGCHAVAHAFLLLVGHSETFKLLAPYVDLLPEIDFHGASGLAAQAKRASADIAGIFAWVAEHAEIYAERARDEIAVGISSRPAIDRARVHAGATPDAFQRLPVLRVGKPFASSVVDDYDVHLVGARTGFAEMAGVDRRGLSRG